MTAIVVGLDGSEHGDKALAHAKRLAKLIGDCELVLVYVIEWSPYSFHTAEELAERHKRREQEIDQAHDFVLKAPAELARAEGFEVSTLVRHGDTVEILDEIAETSGAAQIIIGRTGARGLKERLLGGVSSKLAASATVPVTIIP